MLFNLVSRVGQNCKYPPYMTVYLIISLPKIPYINCIYGSGQPYLSALVDDVFCMWSAPSNCVCGL